MTEEQLLKLESIGKRLAKIGDADSLQKFQFNIKKQLKAAGYMKGIDYVIVVRKHILKKVFNWILQNWHIVIPIIKELKDEQNNRT
jgi:hypothetical protein